MGLYEPLPASHLKVGGAFFAQLRFFIPNLLSFTIARPFSLRPSAPLRAFASRAGI